MSELSPPVQLTWEDTGDEEQLRFRRPRRESPEMDITPLIDMTFLLLIFFLVCSTAAMEGAVELPPAKYGTAVGPANAVVITVADRPGAKLPAVYLADGKKGTPLPDNIEAQEQAIVREVEAGLARGKSIVLIKAERTVKEGEVVRIASAASQVPGVQLYVAVMEVR
jgi:biopolymer transport protein ExbD